MTHWEDLNARARGMTARLLDPDELRGLTEVHSVGRLAELIRGHGYAVGHGAEADAEAADAIDLAVRREVAERLELLGRWAGHRRRYLRCLFEEQTVRSLRALARGALGGVGARVRMRALIPTADLPEDALATLSEQESVARVAVLLTTWHHPYGRPLLTLVRAGRRLDAGVIETVLLETYAERALATAPSGGRDLADFTTHFLATEQVAGILAGGLSCVGKTVPSGRGDIVHERRLNELASRRDRAERLADLPQIFNPGPYRAATLAAADRPDLLSLHLLDARLDETMRWARERPLGPAPVLACSLRLEAEVIAIRRALWGLALGAPPDETRAAVEVLL